MILFIECLEKNHKTSLLTRRSRIINGKNYFVFIRASRYSDIPVAENHLYIQPIAEFKKRVFVHNEK